MTTTARTRRIAAVPVRVDTLLPLCPACGADDAEPEGVTGRFDGSADSSLVLRCQACRALYLDPGPPGAGLAPPLLPRGTLTRRRLRRWAFGLPHNARVLGVDCAGGAHLRALAQAGPRWDLEGTERGAEAAERSRAAGWQVHCGTVEELEPLHAGYHLVLLPRTLEGTHRPRALLWALRSLLLPGGRAVALLGNVGSPSFALFGGRHWHGYDYPRVRQCLPATLLPELARAAGLEVRHLTTLYAPALWSASLLNLLRDWRRARAGAAGGGGAAARLAAAAAEGVSTALGRGGLVAAVLERR